MAQSLGSLCYMEPINMPKEWLKPGAQASDPETVLVRTEYRARGWAGWQFSKWSSSDFRGQDGTCKVWGTQKLLRVSQRILIPSLLNPLHCLDNKAGWGGRPSSWEIPMRKGATVVQDKVAPWPALCWLHLWASSLQAGTPASRLSMMLVRLEMLGWRRHLILTLLSLIFRTLVRNKSSKLVQASRWLSDVRVRK